MLGVAVRSMLRSSRSQRRRDQDPVPGRLRPSADSYARVMLVIQHAGAYRMREADHMDWKTILGRIGEMVDEEHRL